MGVRSTECAQTNHMFLWDMNRDHRVSLDVPQKMYAFYFENFRYEGTNIKNLLYKIQVCHLRASDFIQLYLGKLSM